MQVKYIDTTLSDSSPGESLNSLRSMKDPFICAPEIIRRCHLAPDIESLHFALSVLKMIPHMEETLPFVYHE